MARPTLADLVQYVNLYNPSDGVTAALDDVLAVALEAVEDRVNLPEDEYPERVRQAVLLVASRLAKRSSSPEGVAGWGDLGVVRVLSRDPDVDALLARLLKLDGFA